MSQKRQKKHRRAAVGQDPNQLQETSNTKRISPGARNLVILALIFVSISELLYRADILSQQATTVLDLIGLVILIVAAGMQLRGPSGGSHRRL